LNVITKNKFKWKLSGKFVSKSHTAERSAISDLGGAAENLTFSTVLESKVTTGVKILPVWFSPVWDLENYLMHESQSYVFVYFSGT
jgi:hypothetical protein